MNDRLPPTATAPARIHVVFKTHLDVGFTDFAGAVVHRYVTHYIPAALRLAQELRQAGGPAGFVWTTGSWLIYAYLEQAAPAARRAMEAAIAAGDIRWHALPFTTHTEMMSPGMLRAGLRLSQQLDARFGLRTITAKMTDVPGHTRALVPLLAEAGVRFLHLGVNPACTAPEVPDLFRWRAPGGEELLVMYHKGSYGGLALVDGLPDALCFAHTGDNNGPQSAEQIVADFARLQAQFPGATLRAASMEPFAQALLGLADRLPVVTDEIGDTWIHGIGSDPWKVAAYRALQRQLPAWAAHDTTAFQHALLLLPEHTWGMDEKSALADYVNFARADFVRARAADAPADEAPADCRRYQGIREHSRPRGYRASEAAWAEQRAYLAQAIAALPPALTAEAQALVAACYPTAAAGALTPLATPALTTRHFSVALDPATGALADVVVRASGRCLAAPGHPLGLVRYETFSAADDARYHAAYCHTHELHSVWSVPDFTRAGLLPQHAEHTLSAPQVVRLGTRHESDAEVIVVEAAFTGEPHARYGAPARLRLTYRFPHAAPVIELEVCWFGKPASRLPEALWCTFAPPVAQPTGWRLDKLGEWISPLDVVRGGNRNLHGVLSGVAYHGPDGALTIHTLDAPLVAPGAPRLLEFDYTQPELAGGMHVNLYNNIWPNNFPAWYEDDARFRFRLEI